MRLDRSVFPSIYAISPDRGDEEVVDLAAELFSAGIRLLQLRLKNRPDRDLFELASRVSASLPAAARLLINDRVDLALACGADGVHLGDHDLPPAAARLAAGEKALMIGTSTHSVEEALAAAAERVVDYVAIGPIFESKTKMVRPPLGLDAIRELRPATELPIVAIGGIDASNIAATLEAGADSCAIIGSLYDQARSVRENVRILLDAAGRKA